VAEVSRVWRYDDIESMLGIASRRSVKDYGEQFRKDRMHVEVRDATCKNPTCTICIQTCFYDALRQAEDATVGELYHNCIGCELCTQTCPFDSIHMYGNTAEQQASGDYYRSPSVFKRTSSRRDSCAASASPGSRTDHN
jgi:Fe-S-cluster-containing hydrogenase component 2